MLSDFRLRLGVILALACHRVRACRPDMKLDIRNYFISYMDRCALVQTRECIRLLLTRRWPRQLHDACRADVQQGPDAAQARLCHQAHAAPRGTNNEALLVRSRPTPPHRGRLQGLSREEYAGALLRGPHAPQSRGPGAPASSSLMPCIAPLHKLDCGLPVARPLAAATDPACAKQCSGLSRNAVACCRRCTRRCRGGRRCSTGRRRCRFGISRSSRSSPLPSPR